MSRMENGRKKRRKWPYVLTAALILGAGGAAGGYVLLSHKTEDPMVNLQTDVAFIGSISVTTEGSGSVEAASTKAVALEYDGKLDEIYVERGDQVKNGEVLAVYDTDALDKVIEMKEAELEQINSSISSINRGGSESITSPVPGRVKRIFAAVDDDVTKVVDNNGGLLEISADDKLRVEFHNSSSYLEEGDSVTVDFDTYSVAGTVEWIEGDRICVTIPDNSEYKVDTEATVYRRSGARVGSGKLKSNHPYLVRADYGTITEVNVSKTSSVDVGTTLFRRKDAKYNQEYLDLLTDREDLVDELQELKEYQKNPVVKSEFDGYIVSLDVLEGMPYEKDQQFCTIADEGTLNLKVEIDELDIDGVSVGQHASVVFDAFEDTVYDGTVKKISGIGNNVGGVTSYTVTVELNGDAHLKNAMSATAEITLQTKDSALLVSADAVEAEGEARYVQVVRGDSIERVEIATGLVNEEYVEVAGGLTNGDVVVINARESVDLFGAMMRQQENMRRTMRNQ